MTTNPALTLDVGYESPAEFQEEFDFKPEFTLEVGTKTSTNDPVVVVDADVVVRSTIELTDSVGLYRVITALGAHSTQSLNDLSIYAGVSLTAGVSGEAIQVAKSGVLNESTWTWAPNAPVFVGTNGTLTQTMPSPPLLRVGWAVSSTSINLNTYPVIAGE